MDLTPHEAAVLRAVALVKNATRKLICEHADLGMVVVTGALAELMRRGHVTRTTETPTKGGRPSHIYTVNGELGRAVGVSLEPEQIRLVALDAGRERLDTRTVPLLLSSNAERHTEEVVARVEQAVHDVAAGSRLLQVAVALPGITNADKGTWIRGFQVTGIDHVNIRDLLAERTGAPVLIEDPARAAAVLERESGQGQGAASFVLLYLDYGVGSGVVLGGELYRGRDGLSGEVGHLVVDPAGYRCTCGDVGCLETIASTGGILRCIGDRLAEGVVSTLSGQALTLETVLAAADAGDRLAQSTLYEIGERIGSACATVIKLINPERLIVGGTGALFARYFEPRVRMMLERHVVPEMLAGMELRFREHAVYDEAYGAALMAVESYWTRFPEGAEVERVKEGAR